jgi:hypothetical protein
MWDVKRKNRALNPYYILVLCVANMMPIPITICKYVLNYL